MANEALFNVLNQIGTTYAAQAHEARTHARDRAEKEADIENSQNFLREQRAADQEARLNEMQVASDIAVSQYSRMALEQQRAVARSLGVDPNLPPKEMHDAIFALQMSEEGKKAVAAAVNAVSAGKAGAAAAANVDTTNADGTPKNADLLDREVNTKTIDTIFSNKAEVIQAKLSQLQADSERLTKLTAADPTMAAAMASAGVSPADKIMNEYKTTLAKYENDPAGYVALAKASLGKQGEKVTTFAQAKLAMMNRATLDASNALPITGKDPAITAANDLMRATGYAARPDVQALATSIARLRDELSSMGVDPQKPFELQPSYLRLQNNPNSQFYKAPTPAAIPTAGNYLAPAAPVAAPAPVVPAAVSVPTAAPGPAVAVPQYGGLMGFWNKAPGALSSLGNLAKVGVNTVGNIPAMGLNYLAGGMPRVDEGVAARRANAMAALQAYNQQNPGAPISPDRVDELMNLDFGSPAPSSSSFLAPLPTPAPASAQMNAPRGDGWLTQTY